MSDERDSAGSAGTDAGGDPDVDNTDSTDDSQRHAAVVTRPVRPTGKRTRRAVTQIDGQDVDTSTDLETGTEVTKNGSGTAKKTAKKEPGESRNPFLYVWNFLKQVVAELRKVIWPNRKQMVSYTTVVLIFLVFMVALISGVDYGLARLVGWVFGS